MKTPPAYRHVYQEIKTKIKEGNYKTGELLPPEGELEKQFSVSRTTIRKAISLLTAEGLLRVRQGKGTEVLDISTTQKLNHITSITETLQEQGHIVTTQGIYLERIPAPPQIAESLELESGDSVYKLQRIQCADGTPIAIMVNYLKISVFPDLEDYISGMNSLYHLLEKEYNVILKEATEWLSAVSADFTEAQILHIPIGAPLLHSRRIVSTAQGPCEYSIIKLIADRYEFCIHMMGRR